MEKFKDKSWSIFKNLLLNRNTDGLFRNNSIEIKGIIFWVESIYNSMPDYYPLELTLQLDRGQLVDTEDFFRKVCQISHFLKEDKDVLDFSISPYIRADVCYNDRVLQFECEIKLKIRESYYE